VQWEHPSTQNFKVGLINSLPKRPRLV
jgi:hypothetical protein